MLISDKRLKKYKNSLQRFPRKMRDISKRSILMLRSTDSLKIAIHINGGAGDYLMAARFTRDLVKAAPQIQFDIFCTRTTLAEWIFKNIPNLRLIADKKTNFKAFRREYFCFIETLTFLNISYFNKHYKGPPASEKLLKIIQSIQVSSKKILPFIRNHPYLDGYLGRYAILKGKRRHDFLHTMAGIEYSSDLLPLDIDESILAKLNISPGTYITISNGYDEEAAKVPGAIITKVFPYFEDLLQTLKANFPDVKFIQIGTQTSQPIAGVDINLINQTTLAQATALLKHARLHIDNEGGLVHLAKCVGTPSCVLFGPTLADYFGYEGNLNIQPEVCGGCWWMESTWMTACVKGDSHPACMYQRNVEPISQQVTEFLQNLTLNNTPSRSLFATL